MFRQDDFRTLDHLRVAIRSNECPEDFDNVSIGSGSGGGGSGAIGGNNAAAAVASSSSSSSRSRGSTDGSGGDRPSSSRFGSGDKDHSNSIGSGGGSGFGPASHTNPNFDNNSNNTTSRNTFQWIQNSYNLTNVSSNSQRLNEIQLKKAWNVSEFITAADWHNWFKRFLIELIRESPSPFLRACAVLAQAHFSFARELFQAAFVSCWKELSQTNKDSLIAALLVALQADKFPSDILLLFLNLAEFMEHDVNALPIEPRVLAGLAEKSLAYAKALHYRELEFLTSPASCFESLININKKLNIYDGAMGVLRKMQKMHAHREQSRLREDMLMSLEKWPEALEVYEKKLEVAPFNKGALMNKIKCLTSLGRWEEALEVLTQRADFLGVSRKKVGY